MRSQCAEVTSLGWRDASQSASWSAWSARKSARVGAGQIGEQRVDGVLRVLLVGADHAGRPALDPADDVFVAAALDPAVGVGNGPGLVVERQPGVGTPR